MARKLLSTVNRRTQATAANINKLDRKLGGLLLNNSLGKSIVPYANVAAGGLDFFDQLLPTAGDTTHPQIGYGQSAGISQTMEVRRAKPRFTGTRGTVRITHKELIGTVSIINGTVVTSPTGPSGQSVYTMSPSNSNLFPWLSRVASNYDYFRFNRARLVYVPLCPTTTSGRVMLGFDPDATDGIPYDRSALASYSCSTDGSAWGISKLDLELPTNQPWFQNNNLTATSMYSTSAQGQLFYATWGGTASIVAGELYILYDVTLKDPQPSSNTTFQAVGTAAVVTTSPTLLSPINVSATSTSVIIAFYGGGTFDVVFVAGTTQSTANITAAAAGNGATLTTTFVKTGDGAQAMGAVQINVSEPGYSSSAGSSVNTSTLTFGSLTALGLWSVTVVPAFRVGAFP